MRLGCVVMVVAAGLWAWPAAGQGLAAAAQREKERRAKAGSAGASKTYGDEELKSNPGALANDPSIPPAVASLPPASSGSRTLRTGVDDGAPSVVRVPAAGSPSDEALEMIPRGAGNDEHYWRSRTAGLRAAVAAAEAALADVERRAGAAGLNLPGPNEAPCQAGVPAAPGSSPVALRDRSRGQKTCDQDALKREAARAAALELPAARERLERARRSLANLEDDARKAGAQPGWVR